MGSGKAMPSRFWSTSWERAGGPAQPPSTSETESVEEDAQVRAFSIPRAHFLSMSRLGYFLHMTP